MNVTAGSRLGPYEIVSPIGAGGMGEVYKARDTRLDRSVAIKILPAAFAENAQLRVRFEREAKTISQLNHPHICTLYDVGENYLVMELLEGETLADRIARGPLPIDQVVRYGIEIADALERAHRAGVIHRDLKPGNIMLTKSGAKLLDFGLAKASGFEMSIDAATVQKTLTAEGTIVGTFQYMSPEQLEGQNVDQRTDIFAFGAVLYEMATGRRAFDGRTRTSLIAAIVAADPKPMSELQPLAPVALEQLVRACLAKDADERIQTAHDVALQLRWIATSSSHLAAAVAPSRKRSVMSIVWPLAVVAVAVATWFAATSWQRAHTKTPVYRLTIQTPEGSPLGYASGAMAISRDGSQLAYCGITSTGGTALFVRRLSESAFRVIDGTASARAPFWSPDGRYIGYLVRDRICKVVADGSAAPEEVVKLPATPTTASWGGGTIVVMAGDKLFRVSASGGELSVIDTGQIIPFLPWFLPDARHVLVRDARTDGATFVVDAESKEPLRKVIDNAGAATYANGFLFFMRSETIYAQPFDAAKAIVSGAPQAIAKVQTYGNFSIAFAVADDALVYLPSGSEVHTALQRVDRSGNVVSTIAGASYFFSPRISHDASRVAVDLSVSEGPGDIWIYDVRDGRGTRFTFAPENESAPLWTPGDHDILYFLETANPRRTTTVRKPLAGGPAVPATAGTDDRITFTGDESNDGRWFVSTSFRTPGSSPEIVTYSLPAWRPSPGVPRLGGRAPRISPDSKWLAYEDNASGRYEVYVQPMPPNGNKWQISVDGGEKPVWSRDGKSIYFITPGGKLVQSAVNAGADGSLAAQVPQTLFGLRMREINSDWAQYDVFPDGTFLVNRIPDSATTPMTAILNWRAMLQQR